MAYKVRLSPRARADAQEAADFIQQRADTERARTWKNGLLEAIDTLQEMPLRCALAQEADELGIEVRQLLYFSHRILFRVQEESKTVDVLRVYHSARVPLQMEELPS